MPTGRESGNTNRCNVGEREHVEPMRTTNPNLLLFFIFLRQVLVMACELLVAGCGTNFPTRNQTQAPYMGEHRVLAAGLPQKCAHTHTPVLVLDIGGVSPAEARI